MVSSLSTILHRDLKRLTSELEKFPSELSIWKTPAYINNSAGHLTLHICGNLRHFIGHVLGNSGYERDRENEFQGEPISLTELKELIASTQLEVTSAFKTLSEDQLTHSYPLEVLGYEMTIEYFLLHLTGHLNYHLGQISFLLKSTTA